MYEIFGLLFRARSSTLDVTALILPVWRIMLLAGVGERPFAALLVLEDFQNVLVAYPKMYVFLSIFSSKIVVIP